MKLFFFLAILTIVHSDQITKVRKLIQSFNYEDDQTEKLISETRTLIATTQTEMESLQNTARILMQNSIQVLGTNIRNLSDYSNEKTAELIIFLKNEIDVAVSHKRTTDPVSDECLLVYDYLGTLQTSFGQRLEVALTTAVRNANLTIRRDLDSMGAKVSELAVLNMTLDLCEEVSACVLEVSQKAVDYNTEFIADFTEINSKMNSVPQDALNAAILIANSTVYEDEDYACNSAIIMLSCIESFDDNTTDTTTTWLPPDLPISTEPAPFTITPEPATVSVDTDTPGPYTATSDTDTPEPDPDTSNAPDIDSTTPQVTTPTPIHIRCRLTTRSNVYLNN
uniref:Uncharacterized protein LOC114334187 n=1 Tax=Diabrotica virgifera virgifera TaxID=50390 RepID=A0A6P7FUA3_DIAVI